MGSPRKPAGRPKKGPLPDAPPRRNLTLVKDDVRRSLSQLEPGDAAELLKRVALEHSRDPQAGSIAPYIQALAEMPGPAAESLLRAAGDPPEFKSVLNPDVDDILAEPPPSAIDTSALSLEQQSAVKELYGLLEAFGRQDGYFPDELERLTDRIDELVILNGLDQYLDFGPNTTLRDLQAQLAPSLGDVPASDTPPQVRATRADFPVQDRLSTYMGDKAENYIVKPDAMRGSPDGQFMKLAGNDAKAMLRQAGFTPEQISQMSPEEIYKRVTAFSDTRETMGRTPEVTSIVAGPRGDPVEITTRGGAGGERSSRISQLRDQIAAMRGMPAVDPASVAAARRDAGLAPDDSVAARQMEGRSQQLAALQAELQDILSSPKYAPGDSVGALKRLNQRITDLSGLPVDDTIAPDRFSHVVDRSLPLTGSELNALPGNIREAWAAGQIRSIDDLIAALPPDDRVAGGAMIGPAFEQPEYGSADSQLVLMGDRAKNYTVTDKDELAGRRSAALGQRGSPFANALEEIQFRTAASGPRFAKGGPRAFPDETTKQSAIQFLIRQRDEMQRRMGLAKPPVDPGLTVGEIRRPANRDAVEMMNPANRIAEQWARSAGTTGSELSGISVDPETGERVLVGGEEYFGNPSMATGPTPPLPGFAYGLYPSVDADKNVTHPYAPPDPNLAARNLAWTLGVEEPKFAETITPAMERSIDANWWGEPPAKGQAGSGMYFRNPKTGEPIRRKMMPNKTGLEFLAGQRGGGAEGGRINIQTQARPPRIEAPTPSLDDLESMPLGEAPDTPPNAPIAYRNALEELEALEAMEVEGELPAPTSTTVPPRNLDEINRMLDIPVDEDDTGFLGRTSMNRMPRPLLGGLIA